jgi:DNA-binding NarL/FixJ family response regulator
MIRIAIVDDNRQTLLSLVELLNYEKELEVIITAIDGVEFLTKLENKSNTELPQVVLMDIDMKHMNGIEAVRVGKIKYPDMKFIMLTVFDDEDKLFDSIKAGASGYLLKDEKISVIKEHIINLVEHNYAPMSPIIARKTFDILSKSSSDIAETKDKDSLWNCLSEREVDVLHLLIEGHNYKAISEKLFISPNTVKKHISHIYEKLHVSSKVQIIHLMKR